MWFESCIRCRLKQRDRTNSKEWYATESRRTKTKMCPGNEGARQCGVSLGFRSHAQQGRCGRRVSDDLSTIFRIWEKRFSDESHEKAWLLRVCINACIDLQRSAWKTKVGSIPKDYDVADKSAAPLERNAQESAIDEAMSALSPEQRTAVHLHYFEGYATGEIAQMLGLRPATVRSHLRRARIAMKGQLRQADTKVRKKGQATVPSENESGNKGTAERPEEARLSPCGGPQPTATPSEKPCTTFPDLKASPNNGGAR